MNPAQLLALAAERQPAQEAVVASGLRLTYAEWNSRVTSVARGLERLGAGPGTRVALCAANSEEAATMYFAVHRAGGHPVLLSSRWTGPEIAFALRDAAVRAVFYDVHTEAAVRSAGSRLRRDLVYIAADGAAGAHGAVRFRTLAASARKGPAPSARPDAATILYTSGTTGKPKGVIRTGSADYAGVLAMLAAHGWSWAEKTIAVMPFYHVMGLHTLLAMVAVNGTSVIEHKFAAPRLAELIAAERPTALYLVPTAYHDLVDYTENRELCLHVPKLAYAGAPMSDRLAARCLAAFRPAVFVNHYGCTEMQLIAANRDAAAKPGSAGKAALGTRLRVVAARRGGRRPAPAQAAPPGTVGEIIADAAAPQAFAGYLNRPAAARRAIRGGWYFTGDLGYVDGDGDLYVVGRVDDLIISGGENIHPAEVEAALLAHPAVRDAAVVGLPDERWGQVVTAFVVPAAFGLTAEELDRYCREESGLARFKRPRRYVFTDGLPRSPSGKLLRAALRRSRPGQFG